MKKPRKKYWYTDTDTNKRVYVSYKKDLPKEVRKSRAKAKPKDKARSERAKKWWDEHPEAKEKASQRAKDYWKKKKEEQIETFAEAEELERRLTSVNVMRFVWSKTNRGKEWVPHIIFGLVELLHEAMGSDLVALNKRLKDNWSVVDKYVQVIEYNSDADYVTLSTFELEEIVRDRELTLDENVEATQRDSFNDFDVRYITDDDKPF